ncbi:MAG: hypothetical protein WBL61_20665 [Bryobacteraceae bacterium]
MPHTFEHEHIELIRQLPMEAIIGSNQPANWSKPFWFRYFWQEAISRKSEFIRQSAKILPFFNSAFRLPYKWDEDMDDEFAKDDLIKQGGVWAYSGQDAQWRVKRLNLRAGGDIWNQCPDGVLRDCLEGLLFAGFTRIPVAVDGLNAVQDNAASVVFNTVRLENPAQNKTFHCDFGWRGDSRTFQELDTAGGFKARADSIVNGFAARCNLREAWNPFSLLANRSDYWFREGQADNCLHTSVSIATEFRTATAFPLLERKFAGKKIPTTWAEADTASTPQTPFFKVRIDQGPDSTVYRYADRQQLYLVMLTGSGFNTKSKQQEKFPELAVKFVESSGILASVTFTRVFHGLEDAQGFTALYDAGRSHAPTINRCLAAIADQDLATALLHRVTALFNATVASMPYAAKWIASGSEPVPRFKVAGADATINRVSALDGTVLWP